MKQRLLHALGNGAGIGIMKWLSAAVVVGMVYAQFEALREQVRVQTTKTEQGMSAIAQQAIEATMAIRVLSGQLQVRVEKDDMEHAQMYKRIERLESGER